MVPIENPTSGTSFDGLAVGMQAITGVDIYYNAGHPGVEKPRAHVVLYHDAGARGWLAL